MSRAGIDYLQMLYEIRRAPAKLGMLVAELSQRTRRTMTAIVGRAASAWGTGR